MTKSTKRQQWLMHLLTFIRHMFVQTFQAACIQTLLLANFQMQLLLCKCIRISSNWNITLATLLNHQLLQIKQLVVGWLTLSNDEIQHRWLSATACYHLILHHRKHCLNTARLIYRSIFLSFLNSKLLTRHTQCHGRKQRKMKKIHY